MFELQSGTVIQNRYEIVQPIGRGGMGAVYEAIDNRLGSTVALKQTLVSEGRLRKAFEHEAKILASLRHPALTKVMDHFTEDAGQFLVMEFIDGNDLGELLVRRGGAFTLEEVLQWSYKLLDALDYLHSQAVPIIHRDIKPQNLKLTTRGEIILLDFGLAKGSASLQSRVTSGGSIFGYTPKYAPLEQVQGTGTDPRSDLYALAATMYHLLTNTPPMDALGRAAAFVNSQPDPQPAAHTINPAIPVPISNVIAQTMALAAKDRPTTAKEMLQMLQDAEHRAKHPQAQSMRETPYAPAHYTANDTTIPDPMGGSTPAYQGATIAQRQPAPMPTPTPPSLPPLPDSVGQQSSSSQPQKKKRGWKTYLLWGVIVMVFGFLLTCGGLSLFVGNDLKQSTDQTATAISERQDERATEIARDEKRTATAKADVDADEAADAPSIPVADEDSVSPSVFDTIAPEQDTPQDDMPVTDLFLSDSFDSNEHGWLTGYQEESEWWIGNKAIDGGVYVWDMQAVQGLVHLDDPEYIPMVEDFTVSVTAQRLGGPEVTTIYGILFRYQPDTDSRYLFRVADDNTFAVSLLQGSEWITLIDWQEITAVSPGQPNQLTVQANGSSFSFYINGQFVGEITDDTLAYGYTGLALELNEGDSAVVHFDDFVVETN